MSYEDRTIVELDRLTQTRFGDYVIVDRLGSGGMGTVDLAVHAPPGGGIERPVAIKRLHTHLTKDEQLVRMFLDEARIAARICHPHVCRLLDAGCIDGVWYFTLDLLFGAVLSDVIAHLRTRSDPAINAQWPAVLTRVIVDACEGMHAAHELADEDGELLQVIHRDISPENLFVGFDGAVRVIDFGIASAHSRYHETATGELRGKVAYVAPERLVTVEDVDRRVDVWGLGVVLWEGLTLRPLFRQKDALATLSSIRSGEVPNLRELRPDVPERVARVAHKALSLDRNERFETARDMGVELAAAAAEAGWHADLAEVSEWMNRLLPDAQRRQRRVAELVTAVKRDERLLGDDLHEIHTTGTRTNPAMKREPNTADVTTAPTVGPQVPPEVPTKLHPGLLAPGLGPAMLDAPRLSWPIMIALIAGAGFVGFLVAAIVLIIVF
ncbi:MAG: serine/threonine protein kinase [Sandaracinaceae bacterium]